MNFKRLIKNPYRIFAVLANKGWLNWLPDKAYIALQYRAWVGNWPDLKNPKTFNEKNQWLKLYDRRPEYVTMVDKYLVRQYIADKIGEEYLVPLLGVWDSPEEIDFDVLPDQFVLKCNHTSGAGLCVCRDKSTLDIEATKKELYRGLNRDFYKFSREWPYKHVPRKIVGEKFLQNPDGTLPDYKLMCYNGKVLQTIVCSHRFTEGGLRVTYFDNDWNVMPFEYKHHYPSVKEGLPRPKNHAKMIELAEKLAVGIPLIRVDFYEVNDKIYFGELTFFSAAAYEKFDPDEWDLIQGQWLTLPEEKVYGD